jgi:streptogramin lyase
MSRSLVKLCALASGLVWLGTGCSGRHSVISAIPTAKAHSVDIPTAKSVSPASIKAPPMARTPILPSSLMSGRKPQSVIQPAGWTQLPGGAVFVAASPDESIWVLSSLGSGPDRSIWHYVNGTWTNIPGGATRLAVAPDGTLWAVNSAGGIYAWNGADWSTIAGGGSDITIGSDGTVYVVSSVPGGPFGRGIWHYVGGTWTQLPGAAVRVAASWDTGTNFGLLAPGGVWVANAAFSVYYYMAGYGFYQMPGGVREVSPTQHSGLFALGYLANDDGSYPIYYLDLTSGTWTLQPGAAVSIASNTTNVYAVGVAGGIYRAPVVAPADSAGTIREFSVGISANSGMHDIVAGADGNMWFAEPTIWQIGKITPAGTVSEFSSGISRTGALIGGMAAGPDGNLWFTEYYFGFPNPADVNRIAKMTPAGFVTEYTAGITPNSDAIQIAAGADGNMWFTESAINQIAKITTTGTVTEYSSGISAASGPYYITGGPDGNVWFSETGYTTHNIAKITPSGVITEYPTGASGSPGHIIAGPDGNVWFGGNGITKSTTTGAMTQYLAGTVTVGPLAAGSDGSIWFISGASGNNQSIVQMSTTGTVLATYTSGLDMFAHLVGLAPGPDGGIWFTDQRNNHVGRLSIAGGVAPTPPPGYGAVVVTPNSLNFSSIGESYAQTAGVSQSGFAGPFGLSPVNNAVATVSLLNSTVTVSPTGPGTTTLRVTGGNGMYSDVPISVTISGALVASPSSLAFTNVGAAFNQSVSVSEAAYAGPFLVQSINNAVATASVSGSTITVTPVGSGATTMRVTGGPGQYVDVPIGVTVSNIIINSRKRGAR